MAVDAVNMVKLNIMPEDIQDAVYDAIHTQTDERIAERQRLEEEAKMAEKE